MEETCAYLHKIFFHIYIHTALWRKTCTSNEYICAKHMFPQHLHARIHTTVKTWTHTDMHVHAHIPTHPYANTQ